MGINATQEELASLADTDKTGTSMYGLAHAAQVKGLNATGMILSVDQLKPNYIVLLITVNGLHYSVITSITNTTVYLADSSFGNINMTLEDFTAIYTGYTLIITNNSTNNTPLNGTVLNNQEMLQKKGTILPFLAAYGIYIVATVAIAAVAVYVADQQSKGQWHDYGIRDVSNAYNNWRNSNNYKSSNTRNPIYVGDGGYSYSYSYSYPHGHPTRSNPPKHIPYIPPVYTYGFYAATLTGWAYKTYTTTSNPTILKDQQIYKQYLIKRASELAKIAGIVYQKTWYQWFVEKYWEYLAAKNGKIGAPPIPGDKEWSNVGVYTAAAVTSIVEGISSRNPGMIASGAAGVTAGGAVIAGGLTDAYSETIKFLKEVKKELLKE